MFVQTRQILHQFCCYIAKLNGNQEGLDWIRERLTESNLLLEPVSELREVSELLYDETEDSNDKEIFSHNQESGSYQNISA